MSDIYAELNDQVLTITEQPVIASGGVNEDHVIFTFDPTWDGFEKAACFFLEKGNADSAYKSPIDPDTNTAVIPHEVMEEKGTMYFGVVGVKGDVTLTSQAANFSIVQGAYRYGENSKPPTDDIFTQMLGVAQQIRSEVDEFQTQIDAINGKLNNVSEPQSISADQIRAAVQAAYDKVYGGAS